MIHRYLASTLGLLILALAVLAVRARRTHPTHPLWLPLGLVALVIGQGMLGMLTVTLLLKPLVVMLHLLGGMTTLALLWLLVLRTAPTPRRPAEALETGLKPLALLALAVVSMQIALGGWTSTNYAALACPDFPTCQGAWAPRMDLEEGFVLWRGLGINYEGGILDGPARTAIHLTHRIGALVTLVTLGGVSTLLLLRSRFAGLRRAAVGVQLALAAQLTLGVVIVVRMLPLELAVAHNATAALLLLSVVTLVHRAWLPPGQERVQ
jgi:cytochrome c oxidase assembly protein subunit 15